MKYLFSILLLFTAILLSFSNNKLTVRNIIIVKEDSIYWNNNIKLKVTDFLSNSGCNMNEKAVSSVGIAVKLKTHHDSLLLIAYSYFDKNQSCQILTPQLLQDSVKVNMLMEHETGHFKIDEIYTRKFKQVMLSIPLIKSTVVHKEDSIYNKIWKEEDIYQGLYDKETSHGANYTVQKEWTKKLNMQLKNLEKYSASIFKIRLHN